MGRWEVVEQGRDFYAQVFATGIRRAFEGGKSYRAIRDTIRREWKP